MNLASEAKGRGFESRSAQQGFMVFGNLIPHRIPHTRIKNPTISGRVNISTGYMDSSGIIHE